MLYRLPRYFVGRVQLICGRKLNYPNRFNQFTCHTRADYMWAERRSASLQGVAPCNLRWCFATKPSLTGHPRSRLKGCTTSPAPKELRLVTWCWCLTTKPYLTWHHRGRMGTSTGGREGQKSNEKRPHTCFPQVNVPAGYGGLALPCESLWQGQNLLWWATHWSHDEHWLAQTYSRWRPAHTYSCTPARTIHSH